MSVRHLLTDVFLWLGVALELLACLGVLVMRDVFDRLHFSSPASLGAVSIAVAVVIKDSFSLIGDNAIVIAVFILFTAPLLTHAVGRAARTARQGEWGIQPEEEIPVEER